MNRLGRIIQWLLEKAVNKLYRVRSGFYVISPTAQTRMEKIGLHEPDIDDVFRYGEEERTGKIKRKYAEYTVGINYIKNEDGSYFITSCWKYENRIDWLQPKLYKGSK